MARPTVGPTKGLDLAVALLAGAVGGWMLVRSVERATGLPPVLVWPTVIAYGGVAAIAVGYALRLTRTYRPGQPHVPARRGLIDLAIAKSCLLGGAALGAGYWMFAYLFVAHLDVPGPRERVVRGLVAGVCWFVVAMAGRGMEKACRGTWSNGDSEDDSDV